MYIMRYERLMIMLILTSKLNNKCSSNVKQSSLRFKYLSQMKIKCLYCVFTVVLIKTNHLTLTNSKFIRFTDNIHNTVIHNISFRIRAVKQDFKADLRDFINAAVWSRRPSRHYNVQQTENNLTPGVNIHRH